MFAARFLFLCRIFCDRAAGDRCFVNATLYFSHVASRFGNAELFLCRGMPAVFAFSPASAPWRFNTKNVAGVDVERALSR